MEATDTLTLRDHERALTSRHSHRTLLLARRFRYTHNALLSGQARLYADRIDLVGWKLTGRYRRTIPLHCVVHMDYHRLEEGSNLSLYLDTDEVVELEMEDAHLWRRFFEDWLGYQTLASAKVMNEPGKAAAIAG